MIFRRDEKLTVASVIMLVGLAVIAVTVAVNADPQTLSIASLRDGWGGVVLVIAIFVVAIAAAARSKTDAEKK